MGNIVYFIFLAALILTPAMSHAETEAQAGCTSCSVNAEAFRRLEGEIKEVSTAVKRSAPRTEARAESRNDSDDLDIDGYKSCDGTQKGIASIYGIPGRSDEFFIGRATKSGEAMGAYKLRAAVLRSAPQKYSMGTWVKVTNPKSGKSVILCINDTGRGEPGRVLDLTLAASKAIGNGDLGKVEVECLIKPVKGMKRCDDRVASLIQGE